MTLYDSSVLIEYLDGSEPAISYVESHLDERAVAPALVLYEVYQGEVYRSGPADFDALDQALEWITIIETTGELARTTAELQVELLRSGDPLAARDAMIAGAAIVNGEPLAVADDDFAVGKLSDVLDIDFIETGSDSDL